MSTGSFKVFQVNNVMDLDNYLNTLSSNQAIIAGIPKNNLLSKWHYRAKWRRIVRI